MNSSQISTQVLKINQTNFAGGKRILIVDDQETVLLFLQDRLEQLGLKACPASNRKEGMNLLQEHSFQGVLLDLDMPVVNGLTMLSQLGKRNNDVPVIVMSADPTQTTIMKAIEAGARDDLTKPISDVILNTNTSDSLTKTPSAVYRFRPIRTTSRSEKIYRTLSKVLTQYN